jgi:ankyrin repeat protein
MNVNNIKKNMCALFLAMSVSATAYAADAPELSDQSIIEAQNRLSIACQNGHMEDVISAIGAGAVVNARDYCGWTPLHFTSCCGHLSECQYLIEQGADVNATDNAGRTPLHFTSCYGHLPICEYLIANGADVYAKDDDGYTPLHDASRYGHLGVCEYLIGRGVTVDVRDHDAWTPLIYASCYGHLPICEYLIANGADVNVQDNDGRTAYNLATEPEIKTLFEQEKRWQKRRIALWMASDYAPPNLLKSIPEDVARYITLLYL